MLLELSDPTAEPIRGGNHQSRLRGLAGQGVDPSLRGCMSHSATTASGAQNLYNAVAL